MRRDEQQRAAKGSSRGRSRLRPVVLALAVIAPWMIGVDRADASSRVTICHRTHSVTNPYRRITVSVSAVNGSGNSDHTHHAGPVFDPDFDYPPNAKIWGDIIPNQANGGAGAGLNWDSDGQAIYNGPLCGAMSAQEFFETEVEAGVPIEDILLDLDEQEADEDAALLAEIGSFSNPTGSSGSFSTTTTTSTTAPQPTTTTSTTEPEPTTTTSTTEREPTTTTSTTEPEPTTTTSTTEPEPTTTTSTTEPEPTTTTSTTEPEPTTTTSTTGPEPTTTTTTTPGDTPLGRVEGVVWVDIDRDGVMDPGEAPLAGVPVDLTPVVAPAAVTPPPKRTGDNAFAYAAAASGITSGQVLTAADGTYAFESVVPGSYQVVARLSAAGIEPWWDSDGSGDWNVDITVPVGTATADLAAVGGGGLDGQVYFSATLTGVSAAEVRCTWSGLDGVLGTADDGVFTVQAATDGSFRLENAPYGVYSCAGVDPVSGAPSPAVSAQVASPSPSPVRLPIDAPVATATTTTPTSPSVTTIPAMLPRTGTRAGILLRLAWSLTVAGAGLLWMARDRRRQGHWRAATSCHAR